MTRDPVTPPNPKIPAPGTSEEFPAYPEGAPSSNAEPDGGGEHGVEGDDDIVDVLTAEHSHLRSLVASVADAEGPDREQAFAALTDAFRTHMKAEQEVVRPVVAAAAGDPAADRAGEEASTDRALAVLSTLSIDGDEFQIRLDRLSDAVNEHARTVEDVDLRVVVDGRSAGERVELGRAFRSALA